MGGAVGLRGSAMHGRCLRVLLGSENPSCPQGSCLNAHIDLPAEVTCCKNQSHALPHCTQTCFPSWVVRLHLAQLHDIMAIALVHLPHTSVKLQVGT